MIDRAEIARNYFRHLWVDRNNEGFLALFATDPAPVVRHSKMISAVEEYLEYAEILFGLVPDLEIAVEFVSPGEEWVSSAFTMSGNGCTREGPRPVEFSGSCHLKIDGAGRIVETWNDIDMSRCFIQLGLLPADIFDHCLARIPVPPLAETA